MKAPGKGPKWAAVLPPPSSRISTHMSRKMTQRSLWHDYNGKGTYLITLVVKDRRPLLGTLNGNLSNDPPRVDLSSLGRTILLAELPKITTLYRMASLWKVVIMPDHMHFILSISSPIHKGLELGHIIQGFKYGCTVAYRNLYPQSKDSLFEKGFNDKILHRPHQIDGWRNYLADNPRRLMVKRSYPQLFIVLRNLEVAGQSCSIVGNHFLLDIPNKMAVIVHRRYSESEVKSLRCEWLNCAMNGGVLVSCHFSCRESNTTRSNGARWQDNTT